MPKLDSTVSTLAIATLLAVGIFSFAGIHFGPGPIADRLGGPARAGTPAAADPPGRVDRPLWAATATGRLEPIGGEVRISTASPGRIVEVPVKNGARVSQRDLLVRIDDADLRLRLASAQAEADTRKRERDEEPGQGIANDRRKAEDAAADADRAVFRAREELDSGNGGRAALVTSVSEAEGKARAAHGALSTLLAKGVPLQTRLESGLTSARADVSAAENAIERMRIRAPIDGTVLSLQAKVGEYAAPSVELPLVQLGDLSSLQVRAEVEARDALKVRVGQGVVVKADALPGREFTGEVTLVASALGTPRIAARGPRRPNDVEVLEVVAKLEGSPQLLPGMRVDVYFKLDNTAAQSTEPARAQPAAKAE